MTSERPEWKFYREGKIVPITEDEARHTFDCWQVLSCDRGAALLMIEQLWGEIDRLRGLLHDKDYIRTKADYNRGHLSYHGQLRARDGGLTK